MLEARSMDATQPSLLPTLPVQTGELVDGKFRIEEVLGYGGAGVVVAARHDVLEQRVAIKMLHASPQQRPKAVARLLREARAASRLRSAHVPRVYDVGTLDNGSPFIVMELLSGEDLSRRLDRSGSLPVAEAVGYVLQACDAIGEAHAQGIVHRDLKPQNLFLTESSVVKVLDFGISKVWEEENLQLTTTGAVMGTPRYMSPEQLIDPATIDARSDIWSLGVILHELVTGRRPFDAASFALLTQNILNDEAPKLTGVPSALAAVIARCLKKDKDRRFASVAELASALEPLRSGAAPSSGGRAPKVAVGLALVCAAIGAFAWTTHRAAQADRFRPGSDEPSSSLGVKIAPPAAVPTTSPPPIPPPPVVILSEAKDPPAPPSASATIVVPARRTSPSTPSKREANGDRRDLELDNRF
jgi:serine/threonine protein kinase